MRQPNPTGLKTRWWITQGMANTRGMLEVLDTLTTPRCLEAFLVLGDHDSRVSELLDSCGIAPVWEKDLRPSTGPQGFFDRRFLLRGRLQGLFLRSNPLAAIAINDRPGSWYLAADCFRELGLPYVCLQFGLQKSLAFEKVNRKAKQGYLSRLADTIIAITPRRFNQGIGLQSFAGYSTHVAVLNEPSRELFAANGVASEKMTVTGCAEFDRLASWLSRTEPASEFEAKLTSGKPLTVLLALSNLPYSGLVAQPGYTDDVLALTRAILALPRVTSVLVKPHPDEDALVLDALAALGPMVHVLGPETAFFDSLIRADIVAVHGHSNTALLALASDKPVWLRVPPPLPRLLESTHPRLYGPTVFDGPNWIDDYGCLESDFQTLQRDGWLDSDWRKRQLISAKRWVLTDGDCLGRMSRLIEKCCLSGGVGEPEAGHPLSGPLDGNRSLR